MPINPYFSSHRVGYESEQNLIESMVVESIEIAGLEVVYIPRTLGKLDQIFGEDVLSSFDSYVYLCAYLVDATGYGGESEILSKFGMEIRDTASFIISRKHYREVVVPIVPDSRNEKLKWRPCEGDLIYVPNSKSLFEIKFCEDEEPNFYQLNKKYVWTLRTELVALNNEKFQTGMSEIDEMFGVNMNRLNNSILSETGFHLMTETGGFILSEDYEISKEYNDMLGYGDNDAIKKEFIEIMDFSESNPFGDS